MPDDTTPSSGVAPDGNHPSTDRIRAYLDERLPADDSQQVADHVEECATCIAALDDLAEPVALPTHVDAERPPWDERRMRRAVRRTLVRTALNAVALVAVAVLGLQLIGWFVIHPLLIDRGERVPDGVAASIDLPVMTIPGAELESVTSNVGVLRRITEVRVQRAVGSEMSSLDGYTTRLGPLGVSTPADETITPYGPMLGSSTVTSFDPARLGNGTAVTVELFWRDAIASAEADTVIDAADDLALLWVGFRLPGGEPVDPVWRLGYSACGRIPEFVRERTSGGFGTSGGFRRFPRDEASASQHALTELRRATANLAGTGWLDDAPVGEGALSDIEATASWLAANDPDIVSVVITGPTAAVGAAVQASNPDDATLLEVDFDRAAPDRCG